MSLANCYFYSNFRVQIIRSHWFIAPLWFQSLKNLFPESDYLVTVFHATGAQWGVTHYIFALVTRNNLHYGRTRNPLHKIGNIQSIKFKLTNDKKLLITTENYSIAPLLLIKSVFVSIGYESETVKDEFTVRVHTGIDSIRSIWFILYEPYNIYTSIL